MRKHKQLRSLRPAITAENLLEQSEGDFQW